MTDGTETVNADPDFPVDPETAEPEAPSEVEAPDEDAPVTSELDESPATDDALPSDRGA